MGNILLVARNNLALTKKAVRSALAQDVDCTVIVADNSSTDGTRDWLKTKPCAAFYYGDQLALSACWNRGIRAFWSVGAEEVLVINNDVELRPDTYRILKAQNQLFVTAVGVNDPTKMGIPGDRDSIYLSWGNRPHPDFSCFMITPAVTEQVGWFDESYFPAYCEDADYHVRMHREGIRAVCVDLPYLHHGAATLKNSDQWEQARIRRGADENRKRFKMRYGCVPGTPEYEALFL